MLIISIVNCDNCKKRVDSSRINKLLSMSESGFSAAVYLCGRCSNNFDIIDRYCSINDDKLKKLEGTI